MMEKKNQSSITGKQLSRKEMKNLTGGTAAAWQLYYCTTDIECFPTQGECKAHCGARPCRACSACP
jgi:hypothetical protein